MQNAIAAAIIYIPSGPPIDVTLTRVCAYLRQRGYRLHAVARHVDQALEELDAGEAQIIVMAGPDCSPRAEPGMTTVVDLAAKRDRMLADEPTVRLPCSSPNERAMPPMPRGDDGGFAERFLRDRRNARHMNDT